MPGDRGDTARKTTVPPRSGGGTAPNTDPERGPVPRIVAKCLDPVVSRDQDEHRHALRSPIVARRHPWITNQAITPTQLSLSVG